MNKDELIRNLNNLENVVEFEKFKQEFKKPLEMPKLKEEDLKQKIAQVSLYDINKNIISQLSPLTKKEKETGSELIKQYMKDKKDKFFMLINKESGYFTLFVFNDGKNDADLNYITKEVMECASGLGIIKSINCDKSKTAIEIWINNELYLLFAYDRGVIESGERKK